MFPQLSDKLQEIFKDLRGHGVINESNIDAALRQVRMALLEADVDFQVARKFIARVKEKALGESVLRSITPGQQIVKIFHDELTVLLGGDAEPLRLEDQTRILIVGLNGSGKTTSAAKLALLLKKQGRLPSLVACDLQRPAAIEQLATLGKQIDVTVHVPDPARKMCSVSRQRRLRRREQRWRLVCRSSIQRGDRKSTKRLWMNSKRSTNLCSRTRFCSLQMRRPGSKP